MDNGGDLALLVRIFMPRVCGKEREATAWVENRYRVGRARAELTVLETLGVHQAGGCSLTLWSLIRRTGLQKYNDER